MWGLFHSIFGIADDADRYPETLVKAAIETYQLPIHVAATPL